MNLTNDSTDPYYHFLNKAIESNMKLVVGEPDMLNPNGYENISTIMNSLGKRANIERYSSEENPIKRKWLFVENDVVDMLPEHWLEIELISRIEIR